MLDARATRAARDAATLAEAAAVAAALRLSPVVGGLWNSALACRTAPSGPSPRTGDANTTSCAGDAGRLLRLAVPSSPSLTQLFKEYNKLVARFIALEVGERL